MQPGWYFLPIAAVLFLGACENGRWVGLAAITGTSHPFHGPRPHPPTRAVSTAAAPAPAAPAVANGDEPPPPTPAPAATSVDGQSASAPPLIGLDEGETTRLLGPPHETRDKAPGKTWTYRAAGCSVELSLYPDVATRVFHTLAYRVVGDDNSREGRQACLTRLQSHAQGG